MKTKAFKIIKRLVIGALVTVGLLYGLAYAIYYFKFTPTFFDRPSNLTAKTETIDVWYVNWACNCADFIETKYSKNNPDYETKEEDCIFIEPSDPSLTVPDSFYSKAHFEKKLRLTGQFYQNKGIPKSYEMKTPGEKPDKAKVFRYDKIEIIDND